MDLSQLRAFVETCRTGSYTRAAESLFISQPALHRKVRQLEAELGASLLTIRNRQVVPTELGERVLESADRIFTEIETLECEVAVATETIRVGAVSLIGAMVLPTAIEEFGRRNPGRSVALRSMDADQLTDGLFAGTIDVGVTYAGYVTPDLHSERLWNSEVVCAAAPGHALADGQTHTAAELLAHPIALTLPGMGLRTMIEAWFFAELGITKLGVAFEASTGALLAQYVSASRTHITFLPYPSVKHFNLVHVPTHSTCGLSEIVYCRLVSSPPRRDIDEFLALLRECAADHTFQVT